MIIVVKFGRYVDKGWAKPDEIEHVDTVSDCNFSFDGKIVVTASRDRTFVVWGYSTNESRYTKQIINTGTPLSDAIYFPNGTNILTADDKGVIKIWQRIL